MPLLEPYLLVGGALKGETKAKAFEKKFKKFSKKKKKKKKTPLNFWKRFIISTDIILAQILRPLNILEW